MKLEVLRKKLETLADELLALNMELSEKNPETNVILAVVHLDLQEAEEATSRASRFVKEYLGDLDS
jgi:hypothetical protein